MSTADVRTDGTCDEEQAAPASHAADHGPGQGAEQAMEPAPAAGPSGSDEAGEGTEAAVAGEEGAWDDGLIARRASGARVPGERQQRSRASALWGTDPDPALSDDLAGGRGAAGRAGDAGGAAGAQEPSLRGKLPDQPMTAWPMRDGRSPDGYDNQASGEQSVLGRRMIALRRLVDLSRTRLPRQLLAEADRVLDAADARERLSRRYTTVAIAGATGSGKSSLFNALAGTRLSQAGMRRPTTATPVACSWEVPGAGSADGLLDRLGISPSTRRLMRQESDWRGRIDEGARSELEGLILIDLPDHDSAAEGHREQVERLLRLVDAVVWVVDPEKYADAVLHERYLRPLAGYAEVTFIVLNQTDRLPGDATGAVLNDLRRLLDEDGMALGEHGEPGARVLATSALVGEGIDELRMELASFVAERRAASLRLSADLDVVVQRLRPSYENAGPVTAVNAPAGLTEDVREVFSGQLARAAGAVVAGQSAERAWLRSAERACGTPWAQLHHWNEARRARKRAAVLAADDVPEVPVHMPGDVPGGEVSDDAAGQTDGDLLVDMSGDVPGRYGDDEERSAVPEPVQGVDGLPRVARPVVAHAVRTVVEQAAAGLPETWRRSVRDAAWRGAAGLPEALDEMLREGAEQDGRNSQGAVSAGRRSEYAEAGAPEARRPAPPRRPFWWSLALLGQLALLLVQLAGAGCVLAAALRVDLVAHWVGAALVVGGVLGGSLLSWGCRLAARGPAAEYGRREEWRLRRLVTGCGQVHVLEPVAAELLRYREVREQYVIAAGHGATM